MRKLSLILQYTIVLAIAFTVSAEARNIMKTATKGGIKIELHILPAEPFYTADEVNSNKVKEGMLIISGAKPLSIDSDMHPNRHLVVHIYDPKSGKAITTAAVSISFQKINAKGKPAGNTINVPIVIMQAIGKGVESTHYGNNVVMPAGSYQINIAANGNKVVFHVTLDKAAAMSSDEMHMH